MHPTIHNEDFSWFVTKESIRDLPPGYQRPTEYKDGVAALSNIPVGQSVVLIFFEAEPDAFYVFRPDQDTVNQINDNRR